MTQTQQAPDSTNPKLSTHGSNVIASAPGSSIGSQSPQSPSQRRPQQGWRGNPIDTPISSQSPQSPSQGRIGLRWRVAIATIIAVAPAAILGSVGYTLLGEAIEQEELNLHQQEVIALSSLLEKFMQERFSDLELLSQSSIFTEAELRNATSPEEKNAALEKFLAAKPIYDHVAVVDLNGIPIASSDPEGVLANTSENDWFKQVLGTRRLVWIQPRQALAGEKALSLIGAAPIFDSQTGEMIYIVRTRMSVADLEQGLPQFSNRTDAFAILNDNGIPFMGSVEEEMRGETLLERLPRLQAIHAEGETFRGILSDRVVGYQAVADIEGYPELNWGAVTVTPANIAFAKIDQLLLILLLALGGTTIAIAVLAYLYLRNLLGVQLRLTEQQTAAMSQQVAKEELQNRALELLMEVRPLQKGDLTVRASVTEDEIGTIADSYNATIGSLRKIVTQVQAAATQVTETTAGSEVSVQELAQEALQQSRELQVALDRIEQMNHSIQLVAGNAREAEAAVQQANQVVVKGDGIMNQTVAGIQGIRETVSETAQKVKHLGESSQQISKVVNLISSFAAQTNLLALNASIEAARAGEEGMGFAVVADEVRALAKQSATATAEIEQLIASIQQETNEVVAAMEASTQQVVSGTELVDETRRSLTEIAAASAEISNIVQAIAQVADEQSKSSTEVAQSIGSVSQIARKTSTQAENVLGSFHNLVEVARELQESVSQFKLK